MKGVMGRRVSRLILWLVAVLLLGATGGRAQPRSALSVLFIGNSYTLGHDLPESVRQVALSGGEVAPTVQAFAVGGRRLADHLADPRLEGVLARHWDVVVIQAYSLVPAMAEVDPAVRAEFLGNCRELSARVRNHNPRARIVFFETWARHARLWPDGVDARAGASPAQMQERLRHWYLVAARDCGAAVAPVGEAWQANYRSVSPRMLHEDDGSHPSSIGTRLAALVLAKTIYGPVLRAVSLRDLDTATATDLNRLADAAVARGTTLLVARH